MKVVTKFLIVWAIVVVVLTLLFRIALHYILTNQLYQWGIPLSITFGVSLFMLGWFLGKRHSLNIFVYGGGLHFHLVDYLAFGIISEIWFLLGFGMKQELILHHFVLLYWGIGLLIHVIVYLIKRKATTIKGVDKNEIFD